MSSHAGTDVQAPGYKSSFVQDGLDSEPEIIQKYSKLTGQSVSKCGFFICEKYPFLGASPDSLNVSLAVFQKIIYKNNIAKR